MTRKEKDEWREWWHFGVRRLREFAFLFIWGALAWALNKHIVQPFPAHGLPKIMLFAFESIFDAYTLFELVILLFWPYKTRTVGCSRKK